MYDFFEIHVSETKKRGELSSVTISPKFLINNRSEDLMIRGNDMYAVWNEENNLWSTDEQTVIDIVDREIKKKVLEVSEHVDTNRISVIPKYMYDSDSGSIDKWHKYLQRQSRDRYKQLDRDVTFQDEKVTKEDHRSKRLKYSLVDCDISSYDELMSVLYSPEERQKLEWAVGSIIAGDSKNIQKFIVLYGSAGTGKSTVLNIIQKLFEGYYASFHAKSLTSNNDDFALEDFKTNPLIAIEHDGDLSKIADNTRLNSIVSHEEMIVNEKFKNKYSAKFDSFIFMGTNKPVKITEAKSGLLRRLIDVRPTGNKVQHKRYNKLMKDIDFELGGIAKHCFDVYKDLGEEYYDDYSPLSMMAVTNDFYDFLDYRLDDIINHDPITLATIMTFYKSYCENENVYKPLPRNLIKEELKSYYDEYFERLNVDGSYCRNVYRGFKIDKIMGQSIEDILNDEAGYKLELKKQDSIFDKYCHDCPAQYASRNETPVQKWCDVTTVLSDLNTGRIHYVKVPENHIVIDFDIKDSEGNKCFDKNVEAASKFPPTYAEVSKGGNGIHLHYIYDGDVSQLSSIYDDHIEIKVFTGGSSLRRKLTKCNDLKITHISSGLPLKEKKNMVNPEIIKNEKQLRRRIEKCLKKEHWGATAPEVDFIKKILDDAYESGMSYDLSDMRQVVLIFANNSSNQARRCAKVVDQMHFKSDDKEEEVYDGDYLDERPVIFDFEVFPNFNGCAWKILDDPMVNILYNPTPAEIEHLRKYKLVGHNCRKYDNHIMYAIEQGFNRPEVYDISRRIIDKKDPSAFFRPAYGISYIDTFDVASAANKKSLKKWEIELEDEYGLKHQELGIKWDEPVPEELWPTIMEYCKNDVLATEAVYKHLAGDIEAREILSDLTGLPINYTTNQHTTYLIVGNDNNPQSQFVYTDLREMFPGYVFDGYSSEYKGELVGEGGYVYAEPGIYNNIALLDIASMHPTSAIALNIFGPYTKNFEDLVKARLYIKHGDYEKAGELFDGKLKPYLTDKAKAKALSSALKTAINSVYGLTTATFDHKLKDPRNVDNIVAKRGALFMIDLKEAVQKKGYTVAHIKTDSIKIPNADQEIIDFVMEFGRSYGYTFEHEATYDKMCLVNDAVYIAKYKDGPHWNEEFKQELWWTATGTQFKVPYVFKTLFEKDLPIVFKDKCETKSVKSAMYLDMNEDLVEGAHNYVFIGKTGLFCPIKDGCGGGKLVREQGDKYYAVTGTKDYRWLEAATVKTLNKESDIDLKYYTKLVDDARDTIGKYGDVDTFITN